MEEFLRIGLITKPQGIKGELKVNPLTDDVTRFERLKKTYIDGKEYFVEQVRYGGNAVLVALRGVSDRNQAELLRGKYMTVKREDAVSLAPDSYFIADIIGCELFTESGKIGEITDVTSANTDVFTAKTTDGRILRFPFLTDAIINVDVENKKITLKAKRLGEIGVYEN